MEGGGPVLGTVQSSPTLKQANRAAQSPPESARLGQESIWINDNFWSLKDVGAVDTTPLSGAEGPTAAGNHSIESRGSTENAVAAYLGGRTADSYPVLGNTGVQPAESEASVCGSTLSIHIPAMSSQDDDCNQEDKCAITPHYNYKLIQIDHQNSKAGDDTALAMQDMKDPRSIDGNCSSNIFNGVCPTNSNVLDGPENAIQFSEYASYQEEDDYKDPEAIEAPSISEYWGLSSSRTKSRSSMRRSGVFRNSFTSYMRDESDSFNGEWNVGPDETSSEEGSNSKLNLVTRLGDETETKSEYVQNYSYEVQYSPPLSPRKVINTGTNELSSGNRANPNPYIIQRLKIYTKKLVNNDNLDKPPEAEVVQPLQILQGNEVEQKKINIKQEDKLSLNVRRTSDENSNISNSRVALTSRPSKTEGNEIDLSTRGQIFIPALNFAGIQTDSSSYTNKRYRGSISATQEITLKRGFGFNSPHSVNMSSLTQEEVYFNRQPNVPHIHDQIYQAPELERGTLRIEDDNDKYQFNHTDTEFVRTKRKMKKQPSAQIIVQEKQGSLPSIKLTSTPNLHGNNTAERGNVHFNQSGQLNTNTMDGPIVDTKTEANSVEGSKETVFHDSQQVPSTNEREKRMFEEDDFKSRVVEYCTSSADAKNIIIPIDKGRASERMIILVSNEILQESRVLPIMRSHCGNFVVQRLIPRFTTSQLIVYGHIITKDCILFKELSQDQYATRCVQVYISQLANMKRPKELELIIDSMISNLLRYKNCFMFDKTAHNVILKLFVSFKKERIYNLFRYVIDNLMRLSMDKYGCIVVKTAMGAITYFDKGVYSIISRNFRVLAENPYANYIIQMFTGIFFTSKWADYKEQLYLLLESNYHLIMHFCFNKFASNVVSTLIKIRDSRILNIIASAILDSPRFNRLIDNKTGVGIIETLYMSGTEVIKRRLLEKLAANPFGRLLYKKLLSSST